MTSMATVHYLPCIIDFRGTTNVAEHFRPTEVDSKADPIATSPAGTIPPPSPLESIKAFTPDRLSSGSSAAASGSKSPQEAAAGAASTPNNTECMETPMSKPTSEQSDSTARGGKTTSSQSYVASFRGHKLVGTRVPVPDGFTGTVMAISQQHSVQLDDLDGAPPGPGLLGTMAPSRKRPRCDTTEEGDHLADRTHLRSTVTHLATFDDMFVWEHDTTPDPFAAAGAVSLVPQIATVIHAPPTVRRDKGTSLK